MSEYIGEYRCNNCGVYQFDDASRLTIFYPSGALDPIVKIECEGCGTDILNVISWEDAIVFDVRGANIVGYSIIRGPEITEEEIDGFVENFEKEIDEFLEASEPG